MPRNAKIGGAAALLLIGGVVYATLPQGDAPDGDAPTAHRLIPAQRVQANMRVAGNHLISPDGSRLTVALVPEDAVLNPDTGCLAVPYRASNVLVDVVEYCADTVRRSLDQTAAHLAETGRVADRRAEWEVYRGKYQAAGVTLSPVPEE